MTDRDRHRDLLGLDEMFRTFENDRGSDDDGGAAVTAPAPHKPAPHDSAIALPEPDDDERD
jgi:hypothetical protein